MQKFGPFTQAEREVRGGHQLCNIVNRPIPFLSTDPPGIPVCRASPPSTCKRVCSAPNRAFPSASSNWSTLFTPCTVTRCLLGPLYDAEFNAPFLIVKGECFPCRWHNKQVTMIFVTTPSPSFVLSVVNPGSTHSWWPSSPLRACFRFGPGSSVLLLARRLLFGGVVRSWGTISGAEATLPLINQPSKPGDAMHRVTRVSHIFTNSQLSYGATMLPHQPPGAGTNMAPVWFPNTWLVPVHLQQGVFSRHVAGTRAQRHTEKIHFTCGRSLPHSPRMVIPHQ